MSTEPSDHRFCVLAEAKEYAKLLVLRDLTFARLVDDVLVPYEKNETIFVDGFPMTREKVLRLKVMKEGDQFGYQMRELFRGLSYGAPAMCKMYGDQYHVRLEAVLFEHTEDVTSQVLKAFDSRIKPSLREYLPRREELISAALKMFTEAISILGKTG